MADYVALIDRARITRPTVHYSGLPEDLGGKPRPMPYPDAVLLCTYADGPMLYRYTAEGELAGDTWHETEDAARDQAVFEYGDALGSWSAVPDDAADPHEYAIAVARGDVADPS